MLLLVEMPGLAIQKTETSEQSKCTHREHREAELSLPYAAQAHKEKESVFPEECSVHPSPHQQNSDTNSTEPIHILYLKSVYILSFLD